MCNPKSGTELGRFADDAAAGMRKDVPLVPAASIAGRALVTVVAIMTFLAALTAGAAMLIAHSADDWRGQVAREMTIQVRPVDGRDLDADATAAVAAARTATGIADVYAYSKAQSEALLTPWLGTGLDLSELPVPRLIVVKLDPKATLDVEALRKAVMGKVAECDDRRSPALAPAPFGDGGDRGRHRLRHFRAGDAGNGSGRRFRDARRDGGQ